MATRVKPGPPASARPTGTVTFLFSDIEGSTQRWDRDRAAMQDAVRRHDALMRTAIAQHDGYVFKTIGDAFCAAFACVSDAIASAVDAQRALLAEDFSAVGGLRVRMAISTGTAEERDGDYFGPAVNRVARLLGAATGGQVLLSGTTCDLVNLAKGISLRDLGEHRLKDLDQSEHIFQLLAEGLLADFPPLRSMDAEEIRPTPGFTGRDEELAAVAAALGKNNAVAVICGLGGTGKSSLAREYAWQNRDRYALTWWLNAQTESGIIDGLLRLGSLFMKGLDQLADRRTAAQQVIHAAFAGFAKPLLMIFDNLEDEQLLRSWRPRTDSRILVTSRNAAWGADMTPIPLQTWKLDTAIAYLARESGRTDLTEAEARAIAEALGALPLALAHAAASLRRMRMVAPRHYLEHIDRHLRNAPRGVEYPRSVFATLSAAIAQAEKEAAGAAAILCFAARFAPEAIPDELFRQPIETYIATLRPSISGDALALDLRSALADDVRLDEALSALDSLSLLAFSQSSRAYNIHRLVQLAARDMVIEKTLAWRECSVGVADAAFPEVEVATWPQCDRLLSHACAALDALPGEAAFLPAARLADRCAVYLRERGNYGAAEPLQSRALAIQKVALGPDHPDVATSQDHLAHLYWRQARYGEAEELYLRALEIRETALGPDRIHVATTLNGLGQLYYEEGRYAEAKLAYRRALSIQDQALGPDHSNSADILANLAVLYAQQGRYGEAEPLLTRVLSIEEETFGQDHPRVANCLSNLGVLYHIQRRYGEAEPLFQRALSIKEQILGPEHPDVAGIRNNLAALYTQQMRYEEAEALHASALAIKEKALGPNHPDVAISLDNLAKVYELQRRYAAAEPLLTRALAIFEKAFGRDHPDVAISLNQLANVYDAQGRSDDAARLYERALAIREKGLGPEHALTKALREKLTALQRNGNLPGY